MTVRKADVKRGWGRFCSKACKAKEQEARTGQYASLLRTGLQPDHHPLPQWLRQQYDHEKVMNEIEWGWDGHKDVF